MSINNELNFVDGLMIYHYAKKHTFSKPKYGMIRYNSRLCQNIPYNNRLSKLQSLRSLEFNMYLLIYLIRLFVLTHKANQVYSAKLHSN